MKQTQKVYRVGAYCRLSKDDGTDNESASISTQKKILNDYITQQGWRLVRFYVDDGYSGTNFNRPDFQQMIADIEAGLIDCVITKDLSRLGRNYLDCGLYLEMFFPEHNVRYISINDGVDTNNRTATDITPFRNILNEMYAADISTKIKSAYRARFNSGKFMGTAAPYGYHKDPNDHNHLLIDENTAPIVRKIFDLALEGYGIGRIRRHLNEQHILRPSAYQSANGGIDYERFFEGNDDNRYIWSENSVRMILRSAVYAGNLVGYKRPTINMKSKKRRSMLPEEWTVIPSTHEGIVTQEEFDLVQRMMNNRRGRERSGYDNVFAGIIKCADCGYAMSACSAHRRKRPDIIDCVVYYCGNYDRYGTMTCSSHKLEARDLIDAVITDINRWARLTMRSEKATTTLQRKLNSVSTNECAELEREKRKLQKRLAELDRLFTALYEDRVMERITERNYAAMSERYVSEQLDIEARLEQIEIDIAAKKKTHDGIENFVSLIQNYQGITTLTPAIVNALIDKITVSERTTNEDGSVEQHIKIYYKFVGAIVDDAPFTPTERYSEPIHKTCANCGKGFLAGGNSAKYCPDCRPIMRKQKVREADAKRTIARREQRVLNGTQGYREKACKCCGKRFKPNSGNSAYCSGCKALTRQQRELIHREC